MDFPDVREALFLPGPTPVPPSVALAQALPMTDHRGPRFEPLARDVRARLVRLFGTAGEVCVLSASGTGGLEACVVSLFPADSRLLAVVAGAFGRRWADQAEAMGFAVDRLEVPWGEAATPEAVGEAVARAAYSGVLLTQNETSTGVLQDVRAITEAVHRAAPAALVAVDAISGFPAAPLPMDAWQVDAVVSGSQKAFMLPPGLAFVALGARGLEAIEGEGRRRFYFDLRPFARGDFAATPAVGLWYALARALDLLEAEGEAARHARHRLLGRIVRAGVTAIGLKPLAAEAVASPTVTTVTFPAGLEAGAVRAEATRLGARLAGGQGPLTGKVLRVGHVGNFAPLDMVAAVACLELACARVAGRTVDGVGAAAALGAWQEGLETAATAAGMTDGRGETRR
jgi:aspartate aminotransferase-like enzyme